MPHFLFKTKEDKHPKEQIFPTEGVHGGFVYGIAYGNNFTEALDAVLENKILNDHSLVKEIPFGRLYFDTALFTDPELSGLLWSLDSDFSDMMNFYDSNCRDFSDEYDEDLTDEELISRLMKDDPMQFSMKWDTVKDLLEAEEKAEEEENPITLEDVEDMLHNPMVTGMGPLPQVVEDETFIKTSVKLIEEEGAETFVRKLLISLKKTFPDTVSWDEE